MRYVIVRRGVLPMYWEMPILLPARWITKRTEFTVIYDEDTASRIRAGMPRAERKLARIEPAE